MIIKYLTPERTTYFANRIFGLTSNAILISFLLAIAIALIVGVIVREVQRNDFENIVSVIVDSQRDALVSGNIDAAAAAISVLTPRLIRSFKIDGQKHEQFSFPAVPQMVGWRDTLLTAHVPISLRKGEPATMWLEATRVSELPLWIAFGTFGTAFAIALIFSAWHQRNTCRRIERELTSKFSEHIFGVARQVAHDIRSPLTALTTLEKVATGLTAKQRSALSQATGRIQEISNELLTHSREITPRFSPTEIIFASDISVIVDSMIDEKTSAQRWPEIRIHHEIELSDDQRKIRIDRQAFQRCLSNLIDNAAEAIDGTGTIRLRCRQYSHLFSISVIDTGQGFTLDFLKSASLGSVQSTKLDGNGLGLKYAFDFARAMGGSIRLTNRSSGGAQIELQIPMLVNS